MLKLQLIKSMFNKDYERCQFIFSIQIFIVIFFALIYYLVSIYLSKINIQTRFDSIYECLYLSIITQTTLGYDNIIEEHKYLKHIQILQMLSILILMPFI